MRPCSRTDLYAKVIRRMLTGREPVVCRVYRNQAVSDTQRIDDFERRLGPSRAEGMGQPSVGRGLDRDLCRDAELTEEGSLLGDLHDYL